VPAAVEPSLLVLWWPVVAGGAASFLIIVVVYAISGRKSTDDRTSPDGRKSLRDPVTAGPAWSSNDSWATNISILGGIIGTAAGTSGGLQQYLPKGSTGGFVALTLLFGGAAALAPIVYAAFAKSKGIASDGGVVLTQGTVAGLCMAAIMTLFAALGEIFLGMELARHSAASIFGKAAFIIPLAFAAIIVGVYSSRSMSKLITYAPPETKPIAGTSVESPSLLSPSTRASATL
jgi:hypothetical protein